MLLRNGVKTIHPKRIIIQKAPLHGSPLSIAHSHRFIKTSIKSPLNRNELIALKDEYKHTFTNWRKFSNNATKSNEDVNRETEEKKIKEIMYRFFMQPEVEENKLKELINKDESKTSDNKTPLNKEKKDTVNDVMSLLGLYVTVGFSVWAFSSMIYNNSYEQSVTNGLIWPVLVPYAILYAFVLMIDKAHALIHDKDNTRK